jgi:dipeptidyl aminopeptidase/acylaminoacyl peptidase
MPTPLSPETLVYGLRTAADPQLSPDGERIAYTFVTIEREKREITSHVWLCDRNGADGRALTSTGKRNGGARWSPDGQQLAFVSDRVEQSGIFVLPMNGGEAREITRQPSAISGIQWSPDGSRITFTAEFDPANPTGEAAAATAAPPVRVTSRIDYKQDNRGYLGDRRRHAFVTDVADGTTTRWTTEAYDYNEPQWSPDGRFLSAQRVTNNGMRSQLVILTAPGEGESSPVGPADGAVGTWTWTPDGSAILFTCDPGHTYQSDFYIYSLATGETRRITTDLPCAPAAGFPTIDPPSMPAFLDDRRVLFHAMYHAAAGLWELELDSGHVTQVETTESLRVGFSLDASRRYVAQAITTLEGSGDLLVIDRETGEHRIITANNTAIFAESPAAQWERFDITRDGLTIEAWMLKPQDFDPSRKYPVVIDIHGGPNGFYGYSFNPIQQCLATNGFIVVFCNPRGSTSYGRDFTSRVTEDWGGGDYLDIMAVLDKALERPYCDAGRTGIWGYSYGGYMTAWTISQNHRFKAAVCGAPCFDLESMYGTSDISHEFGELQWGGPPHSTREWYATHSPSQVAHNTRTPTLIIQGEADNRCPVGQAEQMFVTLKKAGCEVEFARYPGGSHLFLRTGPLEHREDAIRRILEWFQSRL